MNGKAIIIEKLDDIYVGVVDENGKRWQSTPSQLVSLIDVGSHVRLKEVISKGQIGKCQRRIITKGEQRWGVLLENGRHLSMRSKDLELVETDPSRELHFAAHEKECGMCSEMRQDEKNAESAH